MIFAIYFHLFPAGDRIYPGMAPTGLTIGGLHWSSGLFVLDSILEGNPTKLGVSLRYLFLPVTTCPSQRTQTCWPTYSGGAE